jgi:hypothetical protein
VTPADAKYITKPRPHGPHRDHDAIAATLPFGTTSYENKIDEHGNRLIWLPPDVLTKLNHLRGPSESYSEVILRIAEETTPTKRTKVK